MLFAPASHERHATKALTSHADAAILDLEDAVETAEKPRARALAAKLIAERPPGPRPAAFVRINGLGTPHAYADLLAVVQPGLDGVMLPKVESPAQLEITDWLLLQLERERGLEPRSITVIPTLETAAGLANLDQIATASPRVRRLSLGAGDLSLDLGISIHVAAELLLWVKIRLVIASRAGRLEGPIDTVFTDLGDADGFGEQARQSRRLGFQGKACIHPHQATIANQVFTPDPEETLRAERLVEAFEAATRSGSAAIVVDGEFVDYPIAEHARQVIARAAAPRKGDG
jgi:citrate lyase subunit beta/citryl-CoA lyase